MKTIGPALKRARLFALGRDVSLALPFGASSLRPTREQIKAAAYRLRIAAVLAERALAVFNQ